MAVQHFIECIRLLRGEVGGMIIWQAPTQAKVQALAISMKANKIAGSSIWELWWGGLQFINHWDFGREMQVSLNSDNIRGKKIY